jgi:gas vesicle protein
MNKLLTGLAIGVAIGILLAPDKGSETRKKIAEKGNDLKDMFNDFVDTLSDKIDSIRGQAEDVAEAAKAEPYSV